jgi:hypothetical protein
MTEEPTPSNIINAAKHFKIQGLLGKNTQERNCALADLNSAKHRLQDTKNEKNKMAFAYLGRLAKYEPNIPAEALEYAIKNGCFFRCESSKIGVFSEIDDYENSKGVVFKAHFTIYGHFLQKLKEPNEKPISYSGNFLIKTFAEHFVAIEGKDNYETLEDFVGLKCDVVEVKPTEEVEVEAVEPVVQAVEPDVWVIAPKASKDLPARFTEMWNLHSRKTNKQLYDLCSANGIQVNKNYKKHDFITALAIHEAPLI